MNTRGKRTCSASAAPVAPAGLLALISQTSLYRIAVGGNGCEPHYRHGDIVVIRPSVGIRPEEVYAGTVVLVAEAIDGIPGAFQEVGLYVLDRQHNAVAGKKVLAFGTFLILGIAEPGPQP